MNCLFSILFWLQTFIIVFIFKKTCTMKLNSSVAIAIALCISTASFAQHSLTKLWETDSLLKVPESVLFDAENHVLYASNIAGTDPWAKDGNGSVAKIGLDGKIIAVDWVTGLNAPKGIGIHNGKLYVADVTDVV